MKTTTTFLFILFSLISFGQEVKLVDFTSSECDKDSDPDRIQARIVNSVFKGDTLLIEVGTSATCCVDFSPSIDFSDGVLGLDFSESGTFCDCTCCYQFVYHITGLKDADFTVKLNGKEVQLSLEKYPVFPVEFKLYNGDTINYVDKYGQKQGYWYNKREDGGYRRTYEKNDMWLYEEEIQYNDSSRVSILNVSNDKSSVFAKYYDNGTLQKISINSYALRKPGSRELGLREEKEFYENGTLKKITLFGIKGLIIWNEYYSSGELHKERFFGRKDQLWAQYFYETGELMAKHYVFKEEEFSSPSPKWFCYDTEGREISREELIEKGLIEK